MSRSRQIRKVLIANRGEVAVRIERACRIFGAKSVAIFSDSDAGSLHVEMADEALAVGPSPARRSYLDVAAVLRAASVSGADAVHPGYGFLSENAPFARAVEAAGLVWIGPPPAAMEAMGLKIGARERMRAAGLPVVPGTHDLDDPAERARVGFPAVVKASAGGGGKGMRVVRRPGELEAAVASCRREAEAAFGDGTLYLERHLEGTRHVEVQVVADDYGRVAALGERDCSLQRRHQKVVEEAPSPAVGPGLRARLCDAAVAAAAAVGYRNAGTVEFLLAPGGEFFFLEMNTRLQVEHPVTEEAWGVDLVVMQLGLAAGERLPSLPRAPSAVAIEARLYAEDPDADFLPQAGRVLAFRSPSGPGVRIDAGIREGSEVTVHYDPMLAKVIARGACREEARRRLVAALAETVVLGVMTNCDWLARILETPEFVRGETDTSFLQRVVLRPASAVPDEAFLAAAALFGVGGAGRGASLGPGLPDPFETFPRRSA